MKITRGLSLGVSLCSVLLIWGYSSHPNPLTFKQRRRERLHRLRRIPGVNNVMEFKPRALVGGGF